VGEGESGVVQDQEGVTSLAQLLHEVFWGSIELKKLVELRQQRSYTTLEGDSMLQLGAASSEGGYSPRGVELESRLCGGEEREEERNHSFHKQLLLVIVPHGEAGECEGSCFDHHQMCRRKQRHQWGESLEPAEREREWLCERKKGCGCSAERVATWQSPLD
jgi:hypothetical protein